LAAGTGIGFTETGKADENGNGLILGVSVNEQLRDRLSDGVMVIVGGREIDAELSESNSDVLGQRLIDGIVLNDGGMDTELTLSVDTKLGDRVSEGVSVNAGISHLDDDKLGDSSADSIGNSLHSEYVS